MAVDDFGLEVLKKSGEEVTPGSKANYYLKVRNTSNLLPLNWDAFSLATPNDTTEVWTYYTGGLGGTLVKTITITYSNAAHDSLVSVVVT